MTIRLSTLRACAKLNLGALVVRVTLRHNKPNPCPATGSCCYKQGCFDSRGVPEVYLEIEPKLTLPTRLATNLVRDVKNSPIGNYCEQGTRILTSAHQCPTPKLSASLCSFIHLLTVASYTPMPKLQRSFTMART
ncbi:hypothetical protein VNO77_26668 [Canavalia gladiata]|uniref:Uncharacterized protein n=1 Tax=Canavalia gladiata TaxID=3824 RepID=A0AAN9KTH3_CANGL